MSPTTPPNLRRATSTIHPRPLWTQHRPPEIQRQRILMVDYEREAKEDNDNNKALGSMEDCIGLEADINNVDPDALEYQFECNLIDAENGFTSISRYAAMWTVRHSGRVQWGSYLTCITISPNALSVTPMAMSLSSSAEREARKASPQLEQSRTLPLFHLARRSTRRCSLRTKSCYQCTPTTLQPWASPSQCQVPEVAR